MRRALWLLSLLLLGCQTPVPVPSGFLGDYPSLQRKPGAGIFFATPPERPGAVVHFSDPSSALTSPTHVVVIRKVEWRAGEALEPQVRDELRQLLAERLRKQILLRKPGQTFLVRTEEDADLYRRHLGATVMRIDAAITSVDKGKGWQRHLIGGGLGDVKMVVEARAALPPYTPGQEYQVYLFTRTAGNPCSGLNVKVYSARYCLKICCEKAARSLAGHLVERIRPPEPEWWKRSGTRVAATGPSD